MSDFEIDLQNKRMKDAAAKKAEGITAQRPNPERVQQPGRPNGIPGQGTPFESLMSPGDCEYTRSFLDLMLAQGMPGSRDHLIAETMIPPRHTSFLAKIAFSGNEARGASVRAYWLGNYYVCEDFSLRRRANDYLDTFYRSGLCNLLQGERLSTYISHESRATGAIVRESMGGVEYEYVLDPIYINLREALIHIADQNLSVE